MVSKQQIIEYFMQILALEKEMEVESSLLINDVPNGELKTLLASWHSDELRHVGIAQDTLNIVITSLGKVK